VHMGTPVRPVDQAALSNTLATARSILGADAFAAVWAEAQSLSLEQVLRTIATATAAAIPPQRERSR
jgi:HAMP domain-containing protein